MLNERMYELTPTDGRKSFYGKARVVVNCLGTEILYSYDKQIISRDKDGNLKRIYFGEWTQTTGRHIKAFCGLDKKAFMALS